LAGGIIYGKNTDMSKYNDSISVKAVEESYNGNISDIDIDFSYGDVIINKSADDKIHVSGKAYDSTEITCEDGKLAVKAKSGWKSVTIKFFGFMDSTEVADDCKITVSLPDTEYDKVKIDMGAGDLTIDAPLRTAELNIDLGAGDFVGKNLVCEDTFIDAGAGDVSLESCTVSGDFSADLGAGSFTFAGAVSGDIDVDCGVGDCTFKLDSPESIYKFKGDLKDKYGSSDGEYTVNVDSGVGKITFEFGNN
jgi:DUF4097 and DUF4098 domain-containing protein YvlB